MEEIRQVFVTGGTGYLGGPATRDTVRRLGLVTLRQMVDALVWAVENPADGVRVDGRDGDPGEEDRIGLGAGEGASRKLRHLLKGARDAFPVGRHTRA